MRQEEVLQQWPVSSHLNDSSSELWHGLPGKIQNFPQVKSITKEKEAQMFLTNQSKVTYKLLSDLAAQHSSSKIINELKMDDFYPKRFAVRERYKFLVDLKQGQEKQFRSLPAGYSMML